MKKTMVIAISMVALVTVVVSAQSGYGPMHGGRHGMGIENLENLEEETISGRIQLREGELPSITRGGTTYSLHIPWALTEEMSLNDGQQVTVEGYVTTARSFDLIGEETMLRVRALESDGTRVVLPSQGASRPNSQGSAGPRSSARGGRR